MRQSKRLSILILLAILMTACPKSTEEKASLKRQAVSYTDTIANSIGLAIGVTSDLYEAKKISKETARTYTDRLRQANDIGKKIGQKVKAIDVNASSLPADLEGMLNEVESLLGSFDFGKYEEIIRAVTDAIKAVNSLKKLVKK